ncbi:hypothetical protein BACCOP_00557 [Phocaeicola coprocola DSM 17136]|uniref:Uncharacterized protein n=1 Tax=Phocaeicola coprocola DSM 17136 TaxID=470145 RepID=B3JFA9_9BACT|nr:hypothetical protein BACCOP_00557 [Phocaeicola coprocola DSM 17136]
MELIQLLKINELIISFPFVISKISFSSFSIPHFGNDNQFPFLS